MIKNFTSLLVFVFLVVSVSATTYQTIDVAGVIKWSIDGGATDCGCTPGSAGKNDLIYVNHPYTFGIGFFTGEIKAFMDINTSMDTVIFADSTRKVESVWEIHNTVVEFQDGVVTKLKNINDFIISNSVITCQGSFKIDETTALITGSKVTFNSTCEVFGTKNQKAGNLTIGGLSEVYFNGNVYGDINGDGRISFEESECYFAAGTIIGQVKMDVKALGSLTLNNGVTIDGSEVIVFDNATIVMLNNITVLNSHLSANTPNLVLGQYAIFANGTVLDFGENVTGFFWGTISFNDVEILLRTDCTMGFLSGVQISESVIDIEEGAIADFTDADIDESDLFIGGLLASDTSTVITKSDMTVYSTGIIDLTYSTYCDFNNSKVNNKQAASELTCGQSYNPDLNQFNIWDGSVWSQGNPPNNVGVFAEIKGNYNTSTDGSFTCGHLIVDDSLLVDIDSLDFIRATQSFNNHGIMIVKNKGSLLMDAAILYTENSGLINVEVVGALSSMRYNIWSTPIKDTLGILARFPDTNPCDIFVFEASSQSWKYDYEPNTEVLCGTFPDTNTVVFTPNDVIYGANGAMNIGLGYFIPGNDSSAVRNFAGVVNNGVVSQYVQTSNLGSNPNWDNDDWNLIGNPYPSGLDLNDFWNRNAYLSPSLTDGVYFWIETKTPPYDQYGSYLAWNFAGGTYVPEVQSEISIVPAGMGFWVLANDPDSSGTHAYDVVFSNSMRVSLGDAVGGSGYVSTRYQYHESVRHRMWINLTNDSSQFDQILVATHPEATDGIDLLFDAHKNYGGEPLAIAMVNNNQSFTIQAFAPRIAVDTSEIELIIIAANTSSHYLEIDSAAYYLNKKRVFLLDKEKGTEQEMLLGQKITLDIDSTGAYEHRFYLKVTNSHITGIENVEHGLDGRIWSFGNEVFYDSFVHNVAQINVYDLRGVQVYQSNPNSRNSSFELQSIAEGIYIVKFTDDFGNERVERLFIR